MITPWASINWMCELMATNATGVRSVMETFRWSGNRRITEADCTHGICSNCFFCASNGTKKMLRSISPAITSIIWARLTLLAPVMAILSLESMRNRHDWVAY